jgi:hypothetical protein
VLCTLSSHRGICCRSHANPTSSETCGRNQQAAEILGPRLQRSALHGPEHFRVIGLRQRLRRCRPYPHRSGSLRAVGGGAQNSRKRHYGASVLPRILRHSRSLPRNDSYWANPTRPDDSQTGLNGYERVQGIALLVPA